MEWSNNMLDKFLKDKKPHNITGLTNIFRQESYTIHFL